MLSGFGQYVVAAAAATYQEHVLSYRCLDEPYDESRFVFECILAGNFQAFSHVVDLFPVLRHSGLYSAFVWKFCFLLQNKLFIPSNLYRETSFLLLC